jgi:ketosteroid isomerase-like protein
VTHRNTETIRSIYERWGTGDFAAGTEHFDPNLVFIMRPEFPDSGTYLGPERVAEYMRLFLEPWEWITIEATEIIEAGDSIVVAVTQRGLGSASRVEAEFKYFHVWTFRGPAAIRFETVRERDEALAAVGLANA